MRPDGPLNLGISKLLGCASSNYIPFGFVVAVIYALNRWSERE